MKNISCANAKKTTKWVKDFKCHTFIVCYHGSERVKGDQVNKHYGSPYRSFSLLYHSPSSTRTPLSLSLSLITRGPRTILLS